MQITLSGNKESSPCNVWFEFMFSLNSIVCNKLNMLNQIGIKYIWKQFLPLDTKIFLVSGQQKKGIFFVCDGSLHNSAYLANSTICWNVPHQPKSFYFLLVKFLSRNCFAQQIFCYYCSPFKCHYCMYIFFWVKCKLENQFCFKFGE